MPPGQRRLLQCLGRLFSFIDKKCKSHSQYQAEPRVLQSPCIPGHVWWEPSNFIPAFQAWGVYSDPITQFLSYWQRETNTTRKSLISLVLDIYFNTSEVALWRSLYRSAICSESLAGGIPFSQIHPEWTFTLKFCVGANPNPIAEVDFKISPVYFWGLVWMSQVRQEGFFKVKSHQGTSAGPSSVHILHRHVYKYIK